MPEALNCGMVSGEKVEGCAVEEWDYTAGSGGAKELSLGLMEKGDTLDKDAVVNVIYGEGLPLRKGKPYDC